MPKLLPATYYAAGKLFEKQGQLGQAARKYSEAVSVNHEYMAAYHRLGIVLTQLGRFQNADDALIRAIELAPDKAFLRNNLAFSYILQKRWADAEAELANALHLNPNFVRARVNMGMVQAKQSRFADALGTFRTVLPEADAYYNMGMLFNSLQRYQDAAEAFERAKTLQPAMTSAQTQLDALASRLAEPRPDEPRAVFTEDGITDAPIEREPAAEIPESEMAAIDEPEIKPETMPELKADADSPESTDDSSKNHLAKAEPKQAVSEFVGPPTPGAENIDNDEQDLVLNFEHDRPDLTSEPQKVDESSPPTGDQVAQAGQQEASSDEPKTAEKNANEPDEEQISSADIELALENESGEEPGDAAAPDADHQPATRTLVTVTVQPQIAPANDGEADGDGATNEPAPAVTEAEPNIGPALEELMVDHGGYENLQEEALVQADDDLADAPNDRNELAGDSVVDASPNDDPSNSDVTPSTSDALGRAASPIVQGRKHPAPRKRSKNDGKMVVALYFDHHRPDFTDIATAGGSAAKVIREVAATSTEQSTPEGELEGTEDLKASPSDLTEPQAPETSAGSINKAPIRILVTQRNSDEVNED